MIKKIVLPTILGILAFGFWISPNFKEIAAGVAIFLFGMLFLEDGFRAFTGGALEKILAKTTDSLWKSISFGVITTTIMQSSSLVSVITISFLSAGLVGLAAGIGIIFGANLGTTTGAWLIAGFGLKVNISAYAMPMLAFGVILVFQKSKSLKGIGYILAGLGLLFLGIHYMKEGFEAFRENIDLSKFALTGFLGLIVFTLIGIFATVVMQSSHATLVLIITAMSVGQVTYENGLALAIGANIGTTITAIIGSLSANYMGKRLAAAHLVFNLVTGIIAIVFISQIRWAVDGISEFVGIAASDYTLKLAVFHTLFNLIGVAVMTPLINVLVRFVEKVIPTPEVSVVEPKYLNDSVTEFPETFMEALRNEILHLYDNAFEVIAHGISLHRHDINSDVPLEDIVNKSRAVMEFDLDSKYETRVKSLYAAIVDFISRAQPSISPDYADRVYAYRTASRDIVQSVKDIKHLRKNVSKYVISENEAIRREYNDLRVKIASVLRHINKHQKEDEDADVLDFDVFKAEIDTENSIANGTLDKLIRDHKITATQATSLMNDFAYTRDIVMYLSQKGSILFSSKDPGEREASELLELDPEELEGTAP